MDANVSAGVAGASVRVTVAIDESDIRPKRIIWANEVDVSRDVIYEDLKKLGTKR